MKTLIRVSKPELMTEVILGDEFRRVIHAIKDSGWDPRTQLANTHAQFFEVDPREVDQMIAHLAQKNPGYEIVAYAMTKSGICPPGELVLKQVTKDGMLPS